MPQSVCLIDPAPLFYPKLLPLFIQTVDFIARGIKYWLVYENG